MTCLIHMLDFRLVSIQAQSRSNTIRMQNTTCVYSGIQ